MEKIPFSSGEYSGYIKVGTYANGRVALQWFSETHEPLATLTKNLVSENIKANQAFIDDNNLHHIDENIHHHLFEQGIIESVDDTTFSGYCAYPLCTLSEKVIALIP